MLERKPEEEEAARKKMIQRPEDLRIGFSIHRAVGLVIRA